MDIKRPERKQLTILAKQNSDIDNQLNMNSHTNIENAMAFKATG